MWSEENSLINWNVTEQMAETATTKDYEKIQL